jgi:hypothetical protein
MKISILADVCPKCNHVHRGNIGILDENFQAKRVCSCGVGEHQICFCTSSKNDLSYYGFGK